MSPHENSDARTRSFCPGGVELRLGLPGCTTRGGCHDQKLAQALPRPQAVGRTSLPKGASSMQIRAATLDDVPRLAAFMGRCTLAHQGVRRASEDEMRQRLTRPGSDPAVDTWLVEDGDVVGFAQ